MIVQIANNDFNMSANDSNLFELLAARINFLIINDLNRLISILRRADVSEKKLKYLLAEDKNAEAGKLIAALYLERLKEKAESRRAFKNSAEDFEAEKW